MAVTYLVIGPSGVESAWDLPEQAVMARERSGPTSYTTALALNSDRPTAESRLALVKLRELERSRGHRR